MEEQKSSQQKLITIGVIAILIVGAGSFYGGMQYQKSLAPQGGLNSARAGQFAGANRGAGGLAGRARGAGFTTGQIIKQDATSITVKTSDGGSKTVYLTDATTIGQITAGTITDLTTGADVVVNGNANPDGSIAASSIQIRPAGSQMPGAGNGGGQPNNASGTPGYNQSNRGQAGQDNIPGSSATNAPVTPGQ